MCESFDKNGKTKCAHKCFHHHHQVPDLKQTLATMPLQTSLSSDNFKKFKPLLCPPVAELQRLSRNVIRCLPLSRLPSTLPVKDKNSKPLRLHTCPKNSICLFLIVFNISALHSRKALSFKDIAEVSEQISHLLNCAMENNRKRKLQYLFSHVTLE